MLTVTQLPLGKTVGEGEGKEKALTVLSILYPEDLRICNDSLTALSTGDEALLGKMHNAFR